MSPWFDIEDVTEKNFWLVGVGELARAKKEDVTGFEVRATETGFQVVLGVPLIPVQFTGVATPSIRAGFRAALA